MDVKEMYDLADIVKDMAEAEMYCMKAEYYKAVTDAMEGGRRTYGSESITGPIAEIRNMIATGGPDTRARIRSELSGLITM